jgi:hypothetical protein
MLAQLKRGKTGGDDTPYIALRKAIKGSSKWETACSLLGREASLKLIIHQATRYKPLRLRRTRK